MRRVLEKKFTGVIIETSASFGLLYCPEKPLIEYRLIDFRDLAVGFIVSFACKTSSDGTLKLKTAHPLTGRFGYRDNKVYVRYNLIILMHDFQPDPEFKVIQAPPSCLLYTSDAADE